MASKGIDFNTILIIGAVGAALYFGKDFINSFKSNPESVQIRQDAATERVESRTDRVEIRQENKTERTKEVVNLIRDVFDGNGNGGKGNATEKKTNQGSAPVPSYANGMLKFTGQGVAGANAGFSVAPEKAKILTIQRINLPAQTAYNLKTTPYKAGGLIIK